MVSSPIVSTALDIRKEAKGTNAGKYPVKLRVTFQEFSGGVKKWIRKYYPCPKGKFFVTPDEFAVLMGNTRNETLKKIRREFVAMEARANKLIKEHDIFDRETFELYFLSTGNVRSIVPHFRAKIEELYAHDQISSAENYESALSVLLEYGGPDLTFGEITDKWLRAFQRWYTAVQWDKEGNVVKPGYSMAALGFHLRCLRHVYKRAIAKHLVTADQYPFGSGRYVIQSVKNPLVTYFEAEVKDLFMDYRSDDPKVNYYHDFWRLSYYCNGANFKDILHLQRKDIHSDYLEFDRSKTVTTDRELKKVIVSISKGSKSGKAIIDIIARHGGRDLSPDAFVFPILDHGMTAIERNTVKDNFVKQCNKYVKRIAKALSLDGDVTTYTARHTYSFIMVNVLGASTELLQDGLGHGSAATTEEYKKKFALDVKRKYAEGL
jgi:integrase/recombinase XerD